MEKLLLALAELRSEIKGFFTNANAATTQAAADQKTIADLKAQLEASNKIVAERDGTIKDLNAQLATTKGEVTAKEEEVKTVKGQLTAETKRVEETLSAMGVDPKRIPAPAGPGPGNSGSLTEQYNSITDPKKKSQFRAKNIIALYEEERGNK